MSNKTETRTTPEEVFRAYIERRLQTVPPFSYDMDFRASVVEERKDVGLTAYRHALRIRMDYYNYRVELVLYVQGIRLHATEAPEKCRLDFDIKEQSISESTGRPMSLAVYMGTITQLHEALKEALPNSINLLPLRVSMK